MPREFKHRLTMACDNLPEIVPPYGQGRQVYIARKLRITQEAVRKWFSGDARPKFNKMRELAKLLDVDEAWLALGIEPEADRKQKRVHDEKTEGAVYLVFGWMTICGGHCAFPGGADPRASYVDFYSIIRGQQAAIHVSVGREVSAGVYEFIVPREFNDVLCVGVIPVRSFRAHFIELRPELVDKHKQRKGSGFSITMARNGEYHTGADKWPQLREIGDLI